MLTLDEQNIFMLFIMNWYLLYACSRQKMIIAILLNHDFLHY